MSSHGAIFGIALAIHVAAGSAGLVLGPIAMFAEKRRGLHTGVGQIYYRAFCVLFASALALSVLDWRRVWWLSLVAAGSYGFALLGYRAAKLRWRGWLTAHVAGQGGSYISMVTAILVVNWQAATGTSGLGSALPWILPTLIGTPIITYLNLQIAAGRRPKRSRAERLQALEDLRSVPEVGAVVEDRR